MGVIILGMAVPIGKWLIQKREKIASANRQKEDERIAKICKEFMDPVIKKLDNINEKVNDMEHFIHSKHPPSSSRDFDAGAPDDDYDDDGGPKDIDGRGPSGSGTSRRGSRGHRPYRSSRSRFDAYGNNNEEMR